MDSTLIHKRGTNNLMWKIKIRCAYSIKTDISNLHVYVQDFCVAFFKEM